MRLVVVAVIITHVQC